MKTLKLTLGCICLPLVFHAQTLTGLWMGAISNDSNAVRKDQSYEIVLTQYKNKVYGYSRATFIVHDTLFYIVKRVLGTIDGDKCEVKDDEIIAHNFPGRLDKGVKMISTFYLDTQDSVWKMGGDWKTNKTKKYYSVSGKLDLAQEKNLDKSKLFPHLEELKLANDVPFYAESKKPAPPVTGSKTTGVAVASSHPKEDQKKPSSPTTGAEPRKVSEVIPPAREVAKSNRATTPEKNTAPVTATTTTPGSQREDEKKTEQAANGRVAATTIAKEKNEETVSRQDGVKNNPGSPSGSAIVENKPSTPPAAAEVAVRKVLPPQVVDFKSDSLELALYDNGEVDGDTVSVLLNGELILAKQGLKATAIKKTIYITPGKDDSLLLVLYAENLGKYPPNTGLLVVHDGEDTYQVRFSADLQQNAAVIFRRKKN